MICLAITIHKLCKTVIAVLGHEIRRMAIFCLKLLQTDSGLLITQASGRARCRWRCYGWKVFRSAEKPWLRSCLIFPGGSADHWSAKLTSVQDVLCAALHLSRINPPQTATKGCPATARSWPWPYDVTFGPRIMTLSDLYRVPDASSWWVANIRISKPHLSTSSSAQLINEGV